MSLLRTIAVSLLVLLLLVPAMTRAVQPLDVGQGSVNVSSFSKSGDIPPDPVVVCPDCSVTPIDGETLLQPIGRAVPASDDVLPSAPLVSPGQSLRAPPVRPLA